MRIREQIGLLLESVLPLLADDEGTWIDSHDIGMSASGGPRLSQNVATRPQHEGLIINLAPLYPPQGVMDDDPQNLIPSSNNGDQSKVVSDEEDYDDKEVEVTSSTCRS